MVFVLSPAARPTSTNVTPSGDPGFSGSTAGSFVVADCDHKGRASPSTFSSDNTSADRLSDFRTSRREKGKKRFPANRSVLDCVLDFLYFVPGDFASWHS